MFGGKQGAVGAEEQQGEQAGQQVADFASSHSFYLIETEDK